MQIVGLAIGLWLLGAVSLAYAQVCTPIGGGQFVCSGGVGTSGTKLCGYENGAWVCR